MLSFDPFSLGMCLLLTLLMDFYFALLIHLRYCGQFGLWFFFPSMVVFSLPSFFLLGIPSYCILVSSASTLKKVLLFFVIGCVYYVMGFRIAKLFLKKRIPAPQKTKPIEVKENTPIPSTFDK